MNTSIRTYKQLVCMSFMLLLTPVMIFGQENESFLARSLGWGKRLAEQFRTTRKKVTTEIPKQRLAYNAALINSAIGAKLSPEERATLIRNLESFKILIRNAVDYSDAQHIMQNIIVPEQPGKHQKQFQGVLLYSSQFAVESDKPFLAEEKGKHALAAILREAPQKRQLISNARRTNTQEKIGMPIFLQAKQWEQKLIAIRSQVKRIEQNPKIMAALQSLEHDPILIETQKKITELAQKIEQRAENPELEKVLLIIQKKDKELEEKLMLVLNNPHASTAQKEDAIRTILAEFETFVSNYPLAQEFLELGKQHAACAQNIQDRVKEITHGLPEIAQFSQLLQEDQQAVEGYNACVKQMQNIGKETETHIDRYNTTIWCNQLYAWFDACIDALQNDLRAENHILSQEVEMKAQKAEWLAIVQGHKDFEAYLAVRELNKQNAHHYSDDYLEAQYQRLEKTEKDMRTEIEYKIANLLNIPPNMQDALDILGITDLDAQNLTVSDKTRIKKAYYQKSRECHSDKNQKNAKAADDMQAKVNRAYEQLTNVLENRPSDLAAQLSQEQRESLASLQEELKYLPMVLRIEHNQARRAIAAIEEPIRQEEILARKVQDNVIFNRTYAHLIRKALHTPNPIDQIDYFSRPSEALVVHKRT